MAAPQSGDPRAFRVVAFGGRRHCRALAPYLPRHTQLPRRTCLDRAIFGKSSVGQQAEGRRAFLYRCRIIGTAGAVQDGFRSASSRIMLREFFAWWLAQLADWLPQELRRSALGTGDALVITPIGPLGQGVEAVAVDQRHNGKESPLGHFALGAIGMADLPRMAGQTTGLRLAAAA